MEFVARIVEMALSLLDRRPPVRNQEKIHQLWILLL